MMPYRLVRAVLWSAIVVVTATAQSRRSDSLSDTFTRWFRDLRAGKLEPGDPWASHAYLAPPQRRGRGGPSATREQEAEQLFRRLTRRGSKEDGDRLLDVIEYTLKKNGGKFWQLHGRYTRFRDAALRAIRRDCPPPIEEVFVKRLESGLTGKKPVAAAADAPESFAHSEPELATVLLKLVGRLRQPRYRHILERCLLVKHTGMQAQAASALADLGYGKSITAIAKALKAVKYSDEIGSFAKSIAALLRATRPEPSDHDLKFTLGLVQDRILELKEWRSRLPLVTILRQIRSRSSIPILITLLEQTNRGIGKPGASGRAASGTLLAGIHEALVDLTGFYADPRAPAQWRGWWDSVKGSFVLAKAKPQDQTRGGTAATFFGIPVTGNRVVFIVDISGSMARPYSTMTVAGGGTRAGRAGAGNRETKLDRAKKELLGAVDKMAPDAKFTVVFFNDEVSVWKTKLVPANTKNKTALRAFLLKYRGQGSTNLYGGMSEAMKVKLDKKKRQPYGSSVDEIFLLSDGAPTSGEIQNTEQILDVVTTWNTGAQVRIHTIYIADQGGGGRGFPGRGRGGAGRGGRGGRGGGGGDRGAAAFMRELAKKNNGRFVQPDRRK